MTADSLGFVKMERFMIERVFIVEQCFKNDENLAARARKFRSKCCPNSDLIYSFLKRIIEKFRQTKSTNDVAHFSSKNKSLKCQYQSSI